MSAIHSLSLNASSYFFSDSFALADRPAPMLALILDFSSFLSRLEGVVARLVEMSTVDIAQK